MRLTTSRVRTSASTTPLTKQAPLSASSWSRARVTVRPGRLHFRRAVKTAGLPVHGIEGLETGEWVLVDCGSVIVHCMQPAVRDYYNLAELWGPTPMKRPAEPA